jgi:probable HAF family extracellular repeat protein
MPKAWSGGCVAPLIVLAVMAGLASSAMAQSFTLMGFVPPQSNSRVNGLSADGTVAAGYDDPFGRGFTWTAAGGRNNFGLALSSSSVVNGISGNGLAVVGNSPDRAFKWSQAGGYQNLGVLPGYQSSSARDANHDGSIVVGTLSNGSGSTPQAFRWTQASGMQGLGAGTRAEAISGDGSTIVGSTGPFGNRPFTWTSGAGLQFLSTIDGSTSGYAFATNHDASVIVGLSGASLFTTMWINGSPVELLSSIPNQRVLTPYGVSDDGSVVVGEMNAGYAAVWTPATLTMRLDDYLIANGVTIPDGVMLRSCAAVSADGRTFAGYTSGADGFGPFNGFVATIPTPCPADLDNDGSLSNGGTRDRAVTIDDLLYLLTAFEVGNLAADLDNGSNTGTRDNAVTIEDLLYFLGHFEEGC